jgi:hypothetical protein
LGNIGVLTFQTPVLYFVLAIWKHKQPILLFEERSRAVLARPDLAITISPHGKQQPECQINDLITANFFFTA